MVGENIKANRALGILPMLTEKHLKALLYVLENKQFYLSPCDKIGKDETFVSKMIPFEKAIYSRIEKIEDEISGIEGIINKQKKKDSIRAKRNNEKRKTLFELLVAHKCLLNKQVSKRLGSRLSSIDGYYSIGFGIRRGYKIVAISETEENNCERFALMNARMSGGRPKKMNFY